jgi:LacI family transcriptional regulator
MDRRFRKQVGRSPHAEIRRVQISKIGQMLIDTNLPLKRIAELAGFENTEYMSVLFKASTGYPPGTYRKKMQDKSIVSATADFTELGRPK